MQVHQARFGNGKTLWVVVGEEARRKQTEVGLMTYEQYGAGISESLEFMDGVLWVHAWLSPFAGENVQGKGACNRLGRFQRANGWAAQDQGGLQRRFCKVTGNFGGLEVPFFRKGAFHVAGGGVQCVGVPKEEQIHEGQQGRLRYMTMPPSTVRH